jgi:hypothetical protein
VRLVDNKNPGLLSAFINVHSWRTIYSYLYTYIYLYTIAITHKYQTQRDVYSKINIYIYICIYIHPLIFHRDYWITKYCPGCEMLKMWLYFWLYQFIKDESDQRNSSNRTVNWLVWTHLPSLIGSVMVLLFPTIRSWGFTFRKKRVILICLKRLRL